MSLTDVLLTPRYRKPVSAARWSSRSSKSNKDKPLSKIRAAYLEDFSEDSVPCAASRENSLWDKPNILLLTHPCSLSIYESAWLTMSYSPLHSYTSISRSKRKKKDKTTSNNCTNHSHPLSYRYNEWVHTLVVSVDIELKMDWHGLATSVIFSNLTLKRLVGFNTKLTMSS